MLLSAVYPASLKAKDFFESTKKNYKHLAVGRIHLEKQKKLKEKKKDIKKFTAPEFNVNLKSFLVLLVIFVSANFIYFIQEMLT
jgi:hypothetical protein